MKGLLSKTGCAIGCGTWLPSPNWRNQYRRNVIIIEDSKSQPRRKPMTICIAINCDCETEGVSPKVIMVADRMITSDYLEIEFEHPKQKLIPITRSCVASRAGNALAPSELFDMVHQKIRV